MAISKITLYKGRIGRITNAVMPLVQWRAV